MQIRDIDKSIAATQSINPAAKTTTANGTGVDLAGFSAAVVLVTVGTRTDGTHVLKIQESDDNSTWADVAAADQSGSFPADVTSNTPIEVGYTGRKRYLRVVTTISGASTGAVYGATVIKVLPRTLPQ
jgi:hypothetical protein